MINWFINIALICSVVAQPDTLWTKIYEGREGRDGCRRMIATFDGGYMLGCYQTNSDERNAEDMFLIKTDSNGVQEWSRAYRWRLHDIFYSVAQSTDSCYVMVGEVTGGDFSGGVIAKVDSAGNLIWTQYYGGMLSDVVVCSDGSIAACGGAPLATIGYLVKTDCNGNRIWDETYGGGADWFLSMKPTRDGGFILVGETLSYGNGDQGYIVKVDSVGQEEWHRAIGGPLGDYFRSVFELESGEIFASGGTTGSDGGRDFWVVKLDSNGDTLWTRAYPHDVDDIFGDLIALPDGGMLLAGERYPDLELRDGYAAYRLDSEGNVLWELYFGRVYDGNFTSALFLDDGSYLLAGECNPRLPSRFIEPWLVRTRPDTFNINKVVLLDPAFPSQLVFAAPYPNPFNSAVRICYSLPKPSDVRLTIFDPSGRFIDRLVSGHQAAGEHRLFWSRAGTSSGQYILHLDANGQSQTRRLMLVK